MKKLLLTLSFAVAVVAAFAQTRTIDWSVDSIARPDTLRSVTSTGTLLNVDVFFKNKGPDTARVGDTIIWQVLGTVYNGSNYSVIGQSGNWMAYPGKSATNPTTSYALNKLTRDIPPGDTMRAIASTTINLTIEPSLNAKIFVNSYLLNGGNVAAEGSGTSANNQKTKDVIWYNARGWAVGMEEVSAKSNNLKVYPNPASDVIHFNIESSYAKQLLIMDITGKMVETINVVSGDNTINTSEYNAGIYLYQVKASNGEVLGSGKFSVSK